LTKNCLVQDPLDLSFSDNRNWDSYHPKGHINEIVDMFVDEISIIIYTMKNNEVPDT
jgi:hypothetical protein